MTRQGKALAPPRGALLEGLAVSIGGRGPAVELAWTLLAGLGAIAQWPPCDAPAGRVCIEDDQQPVPGLPNGVVDLACAYLACAAAPLAFAMGRTLRVSRRQVAAWVLLPWVAARLDGVGAPAPPVAWPQGGGSLAVDLGTEWQRERFGALRAALPHLEQLSAEELARAAQEWRLPVTAFARRGALPVVKSAPAFRLVSATPGRWVRRPERGTPAWPPLRDVVVCDLTTMWGGPFATGLLAALGAEVIKVEPWCRLDGLRGAGPEVGQIGGEAGSRQFMVLNAGKARANLDLREPSDRARFARLVSRSDVVVDSFSPRVMANLGYPPERLRQLSPRVVLAALRAFPPGCRGDWTAYGSGIHAASGLADLGDGTFAPAAVSYPDPVAGLALAAAIVAQLWARAFRGVVSHTEASLWDAVSPLVRFAQPGSLATPLDDRRLADVVPADGFPPLRWPLTAVAAEGLSCFFSPPASTGPRAVAPRAALAPRR